MLFRRIHLQRPYVYDLLGLGKFHVRDHEPKHAQKNEKDADPHQISHVHFLQSHRLADGRTGNEASCPRFPGLRLSCWLPGAATIGIVLRSDTTSKDSHNGFDTGTRPWRGTTWPHRAYPKRLVNGVDHEKPNNRA